MIPTIRPLTPARWKDFTALFGPNGACAGCWCQWIRLPAAEFKAKRGALAKALMRRLVAKTPPGLLAYQGRKAVGWAAVAPRSEYRRLETSRVLKPVDDAPVWSVPCFYIAREARGQGVSVALLKGAAAYAKRRGAKILEGYPLDLKGKRTAAAFAWWGTWSAFQKAGFKEAARRSAGRPIARLALR